MTVASVVGAAAAAIGAVAALTATIGIQRLWPTPDPLADSCPRHAPGWVRQIGDGQVGDDRIPDGHYVLHLEACQTLWFNSGSVVLDDAPQLGGGIPDENVVLLYRATRSIDVRVRSGTTSDVGHEWWAIGLGDLRSTSDYWSSRALQPPNCDSSAGCKDLRLFFYLDGGYLVDQSYPT